MEKPIEAEFQMVSTFSGSLGSLPSIGYPGSATITSYLISRVIFMHQLCFRAVYYRYVGTVHSYRGFCNRASINERHVPPTRI
jgi:hypothetical protein